MHRLCLLLIAALAVLTVCTHAFAYERVAVLVASDTPASADFVREFRLAAGERGIRQVDVITQADQALADGRTLLVAVGVQALQLAVERRGPPVLGVLIPHPAFDKIRANAAPEQVSAVLLDQPPRRQFELLRRLLPKARQIGILLGPTSARPGHDLAQYARESGLKAAIAVIDNEAALTPALNLLLDGSDALLAIPDPLVHHKGTAQTVLLTSYRYQKPVIGFSQAYVAAGALASAYSTPAHFARQAADIAAEYPARQKLPPPQPPRYFSVAINRQVARALGIEAPDADLLAPTLTKEEP